MSRVRQQVERQNNLFAAALGLVALIGLLAAGAAIYQRGLDTCSPHYDSAAIARIIEGKRI